MLVFKLFNLEIMVTCAFVGDVARCGTVWCGARFAYGAPPTGAPEPPIDLKKL